MYTSNKYNQLTTNPLVLVVIVAQIKIHNTSVAYFCTVNKSLSEYRGIFILKSREQRAESREQRAEKKEENKEVINKRPRKAEALITVQLSN
ncbi:hypothetical protein L4D09_25345 [Photobacterium makurazakiensis]|uniref:hypothetical protein n=1 Tax=Photobacterium makurazakiensis TaxID=2910234 RepID=UPI003D12BFC8